MGVAGLFKNKANSAQLGLAGAWAELGKTPVLLVLSKSFFHAKFTFRFRSSTVNELVK